MKKLKKVTFKVVDSEIYVCGTVGCGVEFATCSEKVSKQWEKSNMWHFSRLVRVKETL